MYLHQLYTLLCIRKTAPPETDRNSVQITSTGFNLFLITVFLIQNLFLSSNALSNIQVNGKGDKERIVAITDATAGHIRSYMKLFHPDNDPDSPFIYTVIKGRKGRMSVGNVERIINKYADKIRADHPDLPQKCYPHMIRRTRATNLYQDGTELELVSRILGHSSTETTRIYAVPSVEMMRKAMESGMLATDEAPLWPKDEAEMARLCGLR